MDDFGVESVSEVEVEVEVELRVFDKVASYNFVGK